MDTLQLAAAAQCFDKKLQGQVIQGIYDAPGGILVRSSNTHMALIVRRAPIGLWLAAPSAAEPMQTTWSSPLHQRFKGFRIQSITVPWADRILRVDCRRVQISKRVDRLSLIAECFGGRGNLAILDEQEQIRWAWRWDSLDDRNKPRFLPGKVYQPPEEASFFEAPTPTLGVWLRRIAPRYRPPEVAQQAAMQQAWKQRCEPCAPWWQTLGSEGTPCIYPLRFTDGTPMQEIAVWEALHINLSPPAKPQSLAEHARDVEENRLRQHIHQMQHDLLRWEPPEHYRTLAFALFALPDQVFHKPHIQATDHTSPTAETLNIAVTPGKTLHQQAQTYMHKALRSQRATHEIHRRLQESELQLQSLLQHGHSPPLRDNPPATPRKESSLEAKTTFHETLIDNFKVLWGNNAKENDRLTFRTAKPWDLWFHVQDLGGSHVILRRDNSQTRVPEHTIAAAARLALQHSQSRAFSAEVDWTEVRHIQRKSGGGPGQVIYRHFQTIRVRRDD
ncbi:MAG: NFACT RNA binding domain-containing protein [Acidithiobacillus sp.]